jgi:hypothetical protein
MRTVLATLTLLWLAAADAAAQAQQVPSRPQAPRLIANLTRTEIACRALTTAPWAERVNAFWEGSTLSAALDPAVLPVFEGRTVDVWVVDHKTDLQWAAAPQLVDVRGASSTRTFVAGGFAANVFELDAGTIFGGLDTRLGRPIDIVLDVDRNGVLSSGDWLDGDDTLEGASILKTAALNGPYAVTEQLFSAGTWLGQDVYYPTSIAQLGQLPLVVVSHGNGHNYQWYDHIGYHLASWGCIVMSHTNNTMPGIATASTTTLTNTEYLLANQATLLGGVLNGKIDRTRIAWVGHSRGAEGVAYAHTRVRTGNFVSSQFSLSDIKLVSSIAPTDFLGPNSSAAIGVPYSLWTGGADADVNGCADCDLCQTFQLHERATAERYSISLHGAGHGAFHNGATSTVAAGPCQLTRVETHSVMKAHLLPMVKLHLFGEELARECLWRHWSGFRGFSLPTTSCLVVDLMYRPRAAQRLVIDDFQTNTATNLSSSGGAVVGTVTGLVEALMDDADTVFTDLATDPMNGMTLAGPGDTNRGIVFDAALGAYLAFDLPVSARDVRAWKRVSLRAAQATRDPLTTQALAEFDFSVALVDGAGRRAQLRVSALSMGLSEPYQRTACGVGTGWANEFETVRVDLPALARANPDLDLADVRSVELVFDAASGRIGVDDLALEMDR